MCNFYTLVAKVTLVAKPSCGVALHCTALHYATAYRVLHCIANFFSKFCACAFKHTVIRFVCGNLFANANGERMRAGAEYQVLLFGELIRALWMLGGGKCQKNFTELAV